VKSALRFVALPSSSTQLTRVAFGSCALQDLPQPFWDTLTGLNPDLFLMTGDNVYGDWIRGNFSPACTDDNCTSLRQAYSTLDSKPSFIGFRQSVPMLSIWDDHDLGLNDGGADYPYKDASKVAFLEFWAVPESDIRRSRGGLYFSRMFDQMQIIVLDCRYFKDKFTPRDPNTVYPDPGRYEPDWNASRTMLGEEQWTWLAGELQQPAEVRLIVSSLQVIANNHGWECWGCLTPERIRLLSMLEAASGSSVIVSGDRHLGGLYKYHSIIEVRALDGLIGWPHWMAE